MRIIGIDPGLRVMGWGVIDMVGSRLHHVENGQCRSKGDSLADRLLSLHQQLSDVMARLSPTAAAVEQTFVNRDGAATLKLGQARGIALLVPAAAGLVVGEYAPNHVKKAIQSWPPRQPLRRRRPQSPYLRLTSALFGK